MCYLGLRMDVVILSVCLQYFLSIRVLITFCLLVSTQCIDTLLGSKENNMYTNNNNNNNITTSSTIESNPKSLKNLKS